ncbi:MAG TPA: UbiA family prenyltransferase [Aequorivita sp.]|nr:UbiA family prenyltransferase [Aequorivita sp.]
MKVLRAVFTFYINSSIHVALAVVALLAITVLEYSLSVPNALWPFIFLGTLTGYNYVKYSRVAGLHHRRLTKSLKTIQIFSAVCFVLLAIIAFQLNIITLLVTAGFGLATFFYAAPIVGSKNLRRFSGVKIFVVAFVWAGVTVIVPVVAAEIYISGDLLLTFFQRFMIVIALILPFEIRDVPYDAANLKTLPQQFGVIATKLIGEVVLLLCLFLEFLKQDYAVAYISSLLLFCVVLGWLIVISKKEQTRFFSSFWVEGLPILWYALFILFEQF